MKILFLLRHGLYLRNFESTIRELVRRGHRVHLGFSLEPQHEHLDIDVLARALAAETPNVTYGFVPERTDRWTALLRDIRTARNLLQYAEPRYAGAEKLRKRMTRNASGAAQRFTRLPGMGSFAMRQLWRRFLRFGESAIPADPVVAAYIREIGADLVVASPYVDANPIQVELIKAAQEIGLPTVYALASWDNLTTKGTVHILTDRTLVWNHAQAREAVEIHNVPRERIEITGAALFDQWFDRSPSRDREAFCAPHGFDPRQPIVLYVGSSGFIAEEELPFVTRWLEALRANDDPVVRGANVLVRPHPTNSKFWADANLQRFGHVAVWPALGAAPVDDESKTDYFDTLFHSAGIVGINTSALVEASIFGRRPLTVLDRTFAATQEGTLHFAHLTEGGYLSTARSFAEHFEQLGQELRRWPQSSPQAEEFVARFLRPHGMQTPATPRMADAIEETAKRGRLGRRRGLVHRAACVGMSPIAGLRQKRVKCRTVAEKRRMKTPAPDRSDALSIAGGASAAPSLAPRSELYQEAGRLASAIETAKDSRAWRNYVAARDYVRRLLAIPAGAPSAYWREELAGFEYLLEASPLVVARLRQHSYHVTGIRSHDFSPDDAEGRRALSQKLKSLRKHDRRGLLTPESPELGGFGFEIDGQLYNVDTLKFYECLLTLDHAGLLPADDDSTRRAVLEIGAGWGGFAYQYLKRFGGRTTYVIVDLPATMLFSATYLPTVLPEARVALADESNLASILKSWREYDLIYIPAACWSKVADLPLDLAINMVSFQEMTSRQVDDYAARLVDLDCKRLYSLNRERSPHNCELTAVSAILGQYYDLSRLNLMDSSYTDWSGEKKTRRHKPRDRAKEGAYQHLIGTIKPAPAAPVWIADSARGRRARAAVGKRSRIGLALPAYNETENLIAAIDSLQAQTHGDFRLVIVDDSTNPETGDIAKRYAAADRRIEYRRNPRRLGMVDNWRAGFEAFGSEIDYFAWVSDHDLWHPEWLESLAAVLDCYPDVLMAYPAAARMDAEGRRVPMPPTAFETWRLRPAERFARLRAEGRSFGNMIYGLFRAEALRQAGVFRPVLLPDVLLLWELSLEGAIKQVHQELWYRRYVDRASLVRQRTSLFVDPPWHIRLSWPIVHWANMLGRNVLAPRAGGIGRRALASRMLAGHVLRYYEELVRDASPTAANRRVPGEPIVLPSPPRRAVEASVPPPYFTRRAETVRDAEPFCTQVSR